jgi:hypothetical protein
VLLRLIGGFRDHLMQLQSGGTLCDNDYFYHFMLSVCFICGADGEDGMTYDSTAGRCVCKSCGVPAYRRAGED